MTVQEIQDAIRQLTPSEWFEVFSWVLTVEQPRRESSAAREELIRQLQEAGAISGPDAITEEEAENGGQAPQWQSPGTEHVKMYTYGAVVSHHGRVWVSRVRGLNHWEPGAPGVDERVWQELARGDAGQPVPDFVAGLQVQPGEVYAHGGQLWEVVQPHVTAAHWPPSAVPALWRKYTP